MKHPTSRPLLPALCGLLLSGQVAAADLTVSAAASLTNAFRELAPLFEAKHPAHEVHLNFGSSGALMQQIVKGAPADVFASADQQSMDQAQARGAIEVGKRRGFVSNKLVVIVPADSANAPKALDDLMQPAYKRIAIGLPESVPVGRYTKAVLAKAGLWSAIEPRMIGAQNVRQALDYVARGEVDAGFVYSTDAALMPGKVKVAQRVPTDKPILYPIAPVKGSSNAALAGQFVDFVFSPEAQAVLVKYGFGPPDAP